MTEEEWLRCGHLIRALYFLGNRASDRKRRLFAVACCRRIEDLILRFKGAWRAVVLAERIADGEPISEEAIQLRQRLSESAFGWIDGYWEEKENNVMWCAANAAASCLAEIEESASYANWWLPSLLAVAGHVTGAVGHWARRK